MRERIGSYRIEQVLGQGGMGVVYKGRHDTLERCAAIKALLPKNAADGDFRKRLLREAQAQARLQHRNIVTVYDLIDEDGEQFIAMEYVEGQTLAEILQHRPERVMTFNQALPLFVQILDALEYVHGENIIHRDVKPSNVLVCDGQVKLTDFGIALISGAPRLTAHLQVAGTRQYMSPEQLQGGDVDHRTDIYSAALVLYRMLAGRAPFEANEYLAQINERIIGPPDLRNIVPDLPAGIGETLRVALQVDVQQRFRSAAAFRDALNEVSVGFLHLPIDPAEDVPTQVLGEAVPFAAPAQLAEAELRRPQSIVPWLVIAGTVAAAATTYVLVDHTREFPRTAPVVTRAKVVPFLPPVEPKETTVIHDQPPSRDQSPPNRPQQEPQSVMPIDDGRLQREAEEQRRRDIDALRETIQLALSRAEAALRAEQFAAALEDLESATQQTQSYPADFWQERDEIVRLRNRIIEAQVTAQTRKQQEALWETRLAEVEQDLQSERWLEAQRFAKEILEDARAPAAVTARAKELHQRAKDGFAATFKETKLGPTTNTTRKPSSPPRKNN